MKQSPQKNSPLTSHPGEQFITIKGARTHNLKNIDLQLPRNHMIAITGLSGSGKSSLAFDTIFAEGQRRYVESLSAYARQFLSQMPKPDVDEISGLSPAISIDQKSRSNNPRSTVATITEIYDYLRVLYARIGRPYSPLSGNAIQKMTNDEIVEFVISKIVEVSKITKGNERKLMGVSWNEYRIQLFSPIVRGRKGEYYQMLYDLLSEGFSHVRIDGTIYNLRDKIVLTKTKPHTIELLIDEMALHEAESDKHFRTRVAESVEKCLEKSDGLVVVSVGAVSAFDETAPLMDEPLEYLFSNALICPEDGFSFPEIEPRLFSFNSPYGACPECKGLGVRELFGNEHDEICKVCLGSRLRQEANFVFLGDEKQRESVNEFLDEPMTSVPEQFKDEMIKTAALITKTKKATKGGWQTPGFNMFEFVQLPIKEAHEVILTLNLSKKDEEIAGVLLNEIEARLRFLLDVGLEYLSLNRRANTLSGGEAQRIRLASQLGSKLVGALYVLDEPTIGLHQRDNDRLIQTLIQLRDLGNTIILVEHDEDAVRAADYIVDIGPGAGIHGGAVMESGYLAPLLAEKKSTSESLTLAYLRNEKRIEYPKVRRTKEKGAIKIVGAKLHNIQNINVTIPLGKMVGICGVSGSGKSTFMYEILYKNLLARYDREYRSAKIYNCAGFEGDKTISRVVMVDQSPIGRTPRSNPATYTGAWGPIRDLFASMTESQLRGWAPGRFSFNVKGGRCEACEGRGEIAVEMHFLPTVYVKCDVCNGKRFEKETLTVKYKGKNIHEVLEMTVEEATEFFKDIGPVHDRLNALMSVGLGYIKIGQPANELSGGESQRVKIASELYRPMTDKTVYLLDEPTVGLHFEDVQRLIEILQKLVDRGNSVVLIEHNLDVIKCCDYLLDFGPEGGSGGGVIVAKGTPEEVAGSDNSHTATYLRRVL